MSLTSHFFEVNLRIAVIFCKQKWHKTAEKIMLTGKNLDTRCIPAICLKRPTFNTTQTL